MFDRFADEEHIKWSKEVKLRDKHHCQICLRVNVELHAHHLNSYDVFIDDRYKVDNGITLCKSCHENFHAVYGKGNNTKEQFKQFLITIKFVQKISNLYYKENIKNE